MTTRTTLSAMLAAAAVLAATLMAAAPVFAHARYKSSTPGTGQVLAASPARVEITFTQQIQKVSGTYGIDVTRGGGAAVTAGPDVVDESDRTKLSVPLQGGLPPGRYVVHWKNVSDDDGDPAEGAFSFYVNTQPTAADLADDKRLEQIGAEAEAPAATGTPATTATAAATTGTREPAISAATPLPTTAAAGGDGGGSDTGTYILIAAAILGGALIGFAGWQYAVRRRR
jgi:methionine-rich copper-binding protein CopC